jgi:hypothetical protein
MPWTNTRMRNTEALIGLIRHQIALASNTRTRHP